MATKAVADGLQGIARPPFRMGQKKVYLPNHVITFIRPKDSQPPTLATFKVPLTFNKLDLRDYLWNVYNVEVGAVRSYVNQMRPQQRKSPGRSDGKWYRPMAQKFMMVDLVKPFIWPAAPEDKADWDKTMFDAIEAREKRNMEDGTLRTSGMGPFGPKLRDKLPLSKDRKMLRDQAKELLAGKRSWKPGQLPRVGW